LVNRITNRRVQNRFCTVHVFDEALDTAAEREVFFLAAALIEERNFHAVVQKRKLPYALRKDVVVIFDIPEYFFGREEMNFRAAPFAFSSHFEWRNGVAHPEFHRMGESTPLDRQAQPL